MSNYILSFRIKTGDKVYLKGRFKPYFRKEMNLMYRPAEMDILQGKQIVIALVLPEFSTITESIVCTNLNTITTLVRLPLICIDRSKPLIRNGKKYSLLKKTLYIQKDE